MSWHRFGILYAEGGRAASRQPLARHMGIGAEQELCAALAHTEPNTESPANVDAAKMWREDRKRYDDMIKQTVREQLGL